MTKQLSKKQRKEQERQAKIDAEKLAKAEADKVTATATLQAEEGKQQGGVTIVISSTVLGQKRAEYARHREKGLSEDRIIERMTEDATLFGVSLDVYKGMLSNLKSRGAKGDNLDEKRAEHTVKLQASASTALGYLNGLLTSDVDSLNFPSLQRFTKETKQSLVELVKLLQNVDITTKRGKQSWCFMLHAPVYNFIKDTPTETALLALMVGGWSDKSRSYDQYGIRQEPSGSATFFRDVSFDTPITEPQIVEE